MELNLIEGEAPTPSLAPPRAVVDLDLNEPVDVTLSDGSRACVEAMETAETTDSIRGAVREARVRVRVNGEEAWLDVAGYRLPVPVGGVQVDCPVTAAYLRLDRRDVWALDKAVRLRLWPSGAPFAAPGSFGYPVRQRWFATATQMANEPCYVNAAEAVGFDSIYYHNGLDFGGAEGLVDVLSATDGVIIARGFDVMRGCEPQSGTPGHDQVTILDARGWAHRYAHLLDIEPGVQVGKRVAKGDKIALLGKEGSSGGWAHLHLGVFSVQPSGRWGTEDAYPYVWEAYLREQRPTVVAVARPHLFLRAGETARLDGSRSWSASGAPRLRWRFTDGATADGSHVHRAYDEPGLYSEILEVVAPDGSRGYDFAVVEVVEDTDVSRWPPGIHAAYAPTFGLRPGAPATFLVRSHKTGKGFAEWDFGHGTPAVRVRSDGDLAKRDPNAYARTEHAFDRPGDYLVRVERVGDNGVKAVARLHVRVER